MSALTTGVNIFFYLNLSSLLLFIAHKVIFLFLVKVFKLLETFCSPCNYPYSDKTLSIVNGSSLEDNFSFEQIDTADEKLLVLVN